MKFAVIDFETATNFVNICQCGVAKFDSSLESGNELIESKSWLIKPKGNRYFKVNTELHGISKDTTRNSPSLSECWGDIQEYLGDVEFLVVHNGKFDFKLLWNELNELGLSQPGFAWFDTLEISREYLGGTVSNHKLGTLCSHYGIDLKKWHNAEADAIGCGMLFLRLRDEVKRRENIEDITFDKVFDYHIYNSADWGEYGRRTKDTIETDKNIVVNNGSTLKSIATTILCIIGIIGIIVTWVMAALIIFR